MRGAPLGQWIRTRIHGIIPADAGSTFQGLPFSDLYQDHPRGCGEHRDDHGDEETRAGSSPRMRGALIWPNLPIVLPGIIPADAGSTWS